MTRTSAATKITDPQIQPPAKRMVQDIKRATRRQFSAEEKVRIILDGLRGQDSIAELCRREGIAQSLYYVWSKEFLEAGKRSLSATVPSLSVFLSDYLRVRLVIVKAG